MKRLVLTVLAAALFGPAAGCQVSFNDSVLPYRCDTDGDCGGGGYVCVDGKYCCKKDGEEADHGCDHIDNNCNGQIDEGAGTVEICNGKDDDCDGVIDNGFDLIQDPKNCGACDRACMSSQACMNAVCVNRGEVSCSDGIDNDNNGLIDCADPVCNLMSCGAGCLCRGLKKAESTCDDGIDNDGDMLIDCQDPDCDGAGCDTDGGTGGCTCSGLKKTETSCRDNIDNDGDMLTDCQDPDCAGQLCKANPSTFRCGGGNACLCNDGGVVAETGARCRDRIDNDCNGKIDCAEAACNGASCSPDGGPGCQCADGGAIETNCADRKDNDNDGFTDCMDALPDGGGDCPFNTVCTYLNGTGMVKSGHCAADHTCK
jgi:hypothetical protein